MGEAAARGVVATLAGGGFAVQPVDDDGGAVHAVQHLAGADELAGWIGARPHVRLVWTSTATSYPAALRAQVRTDIRVARCHDLGHTESLLLGHEGRWDDLAAHAVERAAVDGGAAGDDPRTASGSGRGQARLFESPRDEPALADLVAGHADQLRRIAAARAQAPGLPLLIAAESAGALAAVEMAAAGLPWDVREHDAVLTRLLGPRPAGARRPAAVQQLADEITALLDDPGLNLDSQADLLRGLRRAGLPVTSTGRWELRRHDHPVVPLVRRYKELTRLWTANGWAWQEAWVREGRFHPEYVPAGVVSGRWATRGGGALQIPKAVRSAVRAPAGRILVVADAGQLEPRVLAAISRDPAMITATRAGDLYQELAAQALGRPDARAEAKVALLAAMYGGGTGSPALAALRRRFPAALDLLESAARTGEDGGVVRSVLGRACPPPSDGWLDGLDDGAAGGRTRARGRFTRNFVVQASAADWAAVLVAGLRTRLAQLADGGGPPPQLVFFQHDEVVVEAPDGLQDDVIAAVAEAGAEATRLVLGAVGVQIPLDAAAVGSYADKA